MSTTSSASTVSWMEATSPQLEQQLRGDTSNVVLLPWGAIEAHGPHLPVGTDCLVADGLARRVAAEIPGAIVGPVVPFGYAPRTNFAGTVSIEVEPIVGVLRSLVAGLGDAGVDVIGILPAHAENLQLLTLLAPDLARHTTARIVPFLGLEAFLATRNAVIAGHGVSPESGGWHAGASETSVMLALHPELVRMEHARAGFTERDYAREVPATLTAGYRHLSEIGVMGDPTVATAEMGEAILDALVAAYVDVLTASL